MPLDRRETVGQTSSHHETVLNTMDLLAWMFCFPNEGKVFGKFSLLSFHKLCVHMHTNKTKFE